MLESIPDNLEVMRLAVFRSPEVRITPKNFDGKHLPRFIRAMLKDVDFEKIQWHPPQKRVAAYNPLAMIHAIPEWKYPPRETNDNDE